VKEHFSDNEIIELTAVAAAFEFFPRFVSALEVPVTPIPEVV
jgi:alkylhydroperoxidase family enzyme